MYRVSVHAYLICIHGKAITWNMFMIYIYEMCTWIVVDFANSGESITSRCCRIDVYATLIDNNVSLHYSGREERATKGDSTCLYYSFTKGEHSDKIITTLFFQNCVQED